MDFASILNSVKNLFIKPQPNPAAMIENPDIISPLQKPDELTKGLIYKINQDAAMEDAARNAPEPSGYPKTIQYPDWMANAPAPEEMAFLKRLRAERPNYGGSDIEALKLYRKYGDKLLGGAPATTPTPAAHDVLGATTQTGDGNLWDQFVSAVEDTAPKLGYDPSTIIRQKALESNFGRSNFAQERNNFGGIGAYDKDPNQALTFKDITDYLNYYYKLVQSRYPQAYAQRSDPEKYVEGLKTGGYASDPNYVWKVLNTPLSP